MSNKPEMAESVEVHVAQGSCGDLHVTHDGGDGRVVAGHFHPMREGQPIPPGARPARLDHGEDGRFRLTMLDGGKPPQVATDRYRENWERTFGVDKTLN